VGSSGSRTWAPRFWVGANAPTLLRLLWRNRFAVHPAYVPIVAVDGLVAALNSGMGLLESLGFRERLAKVAPVRDPLFILGHWRTGTTLLHELLALDQTLAAPSAYACLAPHHFLLSGGAFPGRLSLLMPEQRPMDDMRIGFDSPFEDEFALCLLGARSPYETLAFPNRGPMTPDMFDPAAFPAAARRQWRETMTLFARKVAFGSPGRRLVLKSPPHTARIGTLLELFPEARFVHIVRNPYEVFPSAVHTWTRLHRAHGWQRPHNRGIEEMVFEIFAYLSKCIERDRRLIPAGRLHEIRYEDLVGNPAAALQQLYARLNLTCPESFQPAVTRYFEDRRGYRRNRFTLTPESAGRISERWGEEIRRYGYGRAAA
jgi:omega-hydroxy-beta-dihydromenaquinone-9 sulfotransferase